MSQQPPPGADPTGGAEGPPGQQELSEEQIRAYLGQLRQADVSQIVAEAFSMLAQGAEVKLGRDDARTLIDAVSTLTEAIGERVDERLKEQMEQVVDQLRMAQVDAEKQLTKMREEGTLPDEEADQLPDDAATGEPSGEHSPAGGPAPGQAGQGRQDQGSSAASRLWTPGG